MDSGHTACGIRHFTLLFKTGPQFKMTAGENKIQ